MLLLLLLLYACDHCDGLHNQTLLLKQKQVPIHGYHGFYNSVLAYNAASNITTDPMIYPVSYGADPTGIKDSTLAFQKAIAEALTRGNPNAILSRQVKDCGGVTINLQGGDYSISSGLFIPSQYGNIHIIDGTIRALHNFTNASLGYLLTIGGSGGLNQDISIENIMFDCMNICFGALHISDTTGAVIGPDIYVLGFNNFGITINSGHEVIIFNSWLGQYVYSDKRRLNATATAIEVNGNDHYISDVVIFSAKIGVVIRGGANILNSIHTYNLKTEYGGIGMLIETQSSRIINCYFDYNDLIISSKTSAINLVSIENSFFLNEAKVRLQANGKQSSINGLSIFDSQFSYFMNSTSSIPIVYVNESNGNVFTHIENVIIDNIMIYNDGPNIGGYIKKTTRGKKIVSMTNSNQFVFDFSNVLLFDHIDINWIQYTVKSNGNNGNNQFIQHYVEQISSSKVIVHTNIPCNCTVYMQVDQSLYSDK